MSRSYAKIIAICDGRDRWKVWFSGIDHVTALGKSPEAAIQKLCDFFGVDQFVMEELTPLDRVIGADQLEYKVPFQSRKYLPRPSLN